MKRVSSVIIQKLEMMAGASGQDPILPFKSKAISALFPYAVRMAQSGQQGMIDAISRVALKSTSGGFMWHRISRYITTLFDESSPPSLNQAILLASPLAGWEHRVYAQSAVTRWAAAALATPYSEAVGQSVVDTLLQIAYRSTLRPHIPIEIWAWLKIRPPLLPECRGRYLGSAPAVVRHIRGLGDIEILKSYFLLVWSEWNYLYPSGLAEMEITIRKEICGVAMRRHREDLTGRLDHVLERLDRELEYFKQQNPRIDEAHITKAKRHYGRLREVLAEVGRSLTEALPGTHPTLIPSLKYTNSCECV
jgi:hypothetical protein